MLLALVAVALAGPARCAATWTGPAPTCALRGEVKATAAGPSEAAARRALKKEIAEVVRLTVASQRARIPTQVAAEFEGCAAVVTEDAFVNCFADDSLVEASMCFAELDDRQCWTGQVVQVEGVGWHVLDAGRDAICKAVDERLVTSGWSDLATRRAVCAAACQSRATVRCVEN